MAASSKIVPLDDLRLLQDLLRARLPLDVADLPEELDELRTPDLILRDLKDGEVPSATSSDPVKSAGS